jgi:hypothetical protein
LGLFGGCSKPGETRVEADVTALRPLVGAFEELTAPSGPGAGQPHVAVDHTGAFLVSWTEPDGELHALEMARLEDRSWSEPQVIASRDDFFVNWADFPSIAVSGEVIYAHWLQRSAPGTYDYDVVIAISGDGGSTWGSPFILHDDGIKAEHGFASMLPLPDSRVAITWLDGREMAGGHDDGHGDMGLRYAEIGPDGVVVAEALLDSRTCECCTTTIAATPDGPLVAWRDRSEEEVRDISYSRLAGARWTEPRSLYDDDWKIEGCPVNGPQSDSSGDRLAIAWFTAAEGVGRVKLSFSSDGGATFEPPVLLAAGENVVGYVDVVLVADDRALVVWMQDEAGRLDLVGREAAADGRMGVPVVQATTSRGRTGFPRLARSGDELLLAWNEKGDSPRIHVARAMISE